MYSPRVVKKNLELYQRKTKRTLKRHSLDYCRRAVSFLNDLLDDEGNLDKTKRPQGLLPDEKSFVKNEIAMCRFDFLYFITRYAHIQFWEGNRMVLFEPNLAQKVMLSYWADSQERGLAIAVTAPKARQVGVTTLTEAAIAHRVQFFRNVNAVVGSSDPDKSKLMAQKMEKIWDNEPWWMRPRATTYRAGTLIEFNHNNHDSAVSIQHGSQFTGIARGTTTDTIHLSECSDFLNPDELVDASLLHAFHEHSAGAGGFLVLESTCKGRNNWWHRKWKTSKEKWPRTLLRPVFLPWFLAPNLYPTEAELRRNPVPADWIPSETTVKHAERAHDYVQQWPMLRKHLGQHWKMAKEQMWWWEIHYEEAKAEKKLADFFSETPADDIEAFQASGHSAFDAEIIIETRNRAGKNTPVGVFAITGEACSERLYPDRRDIDFDMPRIPINARVLGGTSIRFELLPLKFSQELDPSGKIFIWKFPEEGREYNFGVDTSDGIGQDRSIIQGMRLSDPIDMKSMDEQILEFASPYINSRDLWPVCLALGTMYTTRVKGKLKQPRMVIECNGNGEIVQYELQKLGWWNFHPWMQYDNRRPNRLPNKIGWFTNHRTRTMAVDTVVSALRDGWLIINSPWFVDEMQDFARNENVASLKADAGAHDDRIMAMAFCLTSTYINEIMNGARSFLIGKKNRPEHESPQTVNLHESTYNEKMKQAMKKQPYASFGSYNPY